MNVVLSALLIPRVGIIGVAIGTAVSHLLDFPIHLRFLLQQTGVTLADWSREVVLPVYPLLILPGVIAWGLSRTALASSLVGITIACSIALAVYWAALFGFALSEAEKQDVARAVGALRARFARGGQDSGDGAG
jgi:Na+-driven multidrug efflux pump